MATPTTTAEHRGNTIIVRGARVHNLQNIDVDIPHNALVVMTGVSGSGKSSLAFDTLFAEGQRRYLESLSTYTRQFLNQLERPDVDRIAGLPPTIGIEQKTGSVQPRSTLATTTQIYDFLRVLYARAGQAHCPDCGIPVSRQTSQQIVDQILSLEERRKVMILAPLVKGRKGLHRRVFEKICREGFVRARVNGDIVDATAPPELARGKIHNIDAVVDRIVVKDGIRPRLQESVDLALTHGDGTCLVSFQEGDVWQDRLYSERFACPACRQSFPDLDPRTFSFNSPYGACPDCDGLGVETVDKTAGQVDKPQSAESEPLPVCPACQGGRLNAFARAVTLGDMPLHEFTALPIAKAIDEVTRLTDYFRLDDGIPQATAEGRIVATKTLPEIASRLGFLKDVGLDYLSLDRPARTLSGGEFQRAQLAACLGSGLVGVCYILDEPTIGLHSRDTEQLIRTLEELRDQGNSLIVVEHDAGMMRRADYLIDLGPGAGKEGGQIVAQGIPETVAQHPESATGRYLREGTIAAAVASEGGWGRPQGAPTGDSLRRTPATPTQKSVLIEGARLHNLKKIDVQIPLGLFVCATGVSGSGKSSLIVKTLIPAVKRSLANEPNEGPFDQLKGIEHIARIVEIDQKPIGRTGRSNPATYTGIWDEVRRLFSRTREARLRGYKARRFSFNSREGRCEGCKGWGANRIEMQFMPDMYVLCPECKGDRFNRQTLSVRFAGKNVADVLRMRIDEAVHFFQDIPKLRSRLETLHDVGLGYLHIGQSSLTLSGGEAQRVKLAAELTRTSDTHTLFVLDEPTTGLHPDDISRLIALLGRLVDCGNSVLVIEHQLDVIAAADWVIDLGPEGGEGGGRVVASGPPAEIATAVTSHTGTALREYYAQQPSRSSK